MTVHDHGSHFAVTTVVITPDVIKKVVDEHETVDMPAWYDHSTVLNRGSAERQVNVSSGYFSCVIGYK